MFDNQEKANIQKYFEVSLDDLDKTTFEQKRKQLRAKYHPDNFAKYDDETVQEMATERFQVMETLMNKMADYYAGKLKPGSNGADLYRHSAAIFAAKKLKIEIITRDKDLKYLLFGRRYRWLTYGETFKIPNTDATLIMDEDHRGNSIGYRETIRVYLTFGEEQKLVEIVNWLYAGIAAGATKLLIAGDIVEVNAAAILQALQQHTFLRLK